MRPILLVLVALMVLGMPLQLWAQTTDTTNQETQRLRQIIEQQKLGTYCRVTLKTGEKIQGELTYRVEGHFELTANDHSQAIPYATVKEIKTGRTFGQRLKRDVGFVFSTAGYALMFPGALLFLGVLALNSSSSCGASGKQPPPTVDGPETTGLINSISGYIVYEQPCGEITGVILPSQKEMAVRAQRKGIGYVYMLSGPDAEGRIAFIEGHLKKRHSLKIIRLDGQEEQEIFSRPGDALWDHVVGGLALSPSGGSAAVIGKLNRVQMRNPDALLEEGPLEIWDTKNKTVHQLEIMALGGGISWFPDGKRLAYVELVSRESVNDELWANFFTKESRSSFNPGWGKVPVVSVVDIETGKKEALSVGVNPIISPDGNSILITDLSHQPQMMELTTRTLHPISVPGFIGPVAFLDTNLLLYWGFPTTGTTLRWTENNSPLVGPKLMLTLKVAKLGTKNFQTVVPYIDPRQEVSFGKGKL